MQRTTDKNFTLKSVLVLTPSRSLTDVGGERRTMRTPFASRSIDDPNVAKTRWHLPMRSTRLALLLPGVLSGLTNMDVAAVVTFTQSGVQYGLASLKFQIASIPIMYAFQELGGRLGLQARKGLLTLTREQLGNRTCLLALCVLISLCIATLCCEAFGVAAVAELWRAPKSMAVAAYTTLLLYALASKSQRTEYLWLCLAMLLAFFVVLAGMAATKRNLGWGSLGVLDLDSARYDLLVVSATLGSTLTPFLFYYQCAAAIEADVSTDLDLAELRANIGVGIVLAVACSVGVTISAAYEFWNVEDAPRINTIQDCGDAFSTALGVSGSIIFSLGLVGAAFTSSLCALNTLRMAWHETFQDKSSDDATCVLLADKPLLLESKTPMTTSSIDASVVVCVVALAVCNLTVLTTSRGQQTKFEVISQDLDCAVIPPALFLGIKVARAALSKLEYSDSEFRAHIVGSVVISIAALTPFILAVLSQTGLLS